MRTMCKSVHIGDVVAFSLTPRVVQRVEIGIPVIMRTDVVDTVYTASRHMGA